MADLNNFNKHVSEIIKPVMKNLGFSKKNLKFSRENGDFIEVITIQRSQFNMAGFANEFYVNYYWHKKPDEKVWIYEVRLPKKPDFECPARYAEYYSDFSAEARAKFSKEEVQEIHRYMMATCWKYLDEAELVLLLKNLATLLANYTDNIFSSIEEKISQMKEKPPRANPELIEIFKKIIDYCTYIN